MVKEFDSMEDSNRSSNPSIHDVSDPARRTVLRGTLGVAAAALYGPLAAGCAASAVKREAPAALVPSIGFKAIAVDASDKLVVPEGYIASVIAAWGEPIGVPGNMPAFKHDGSNTAAEQSVQMGMHHDAIEYFPLGGSSTRGLLAMNHEYTDDGLLHVGGFNNMNAEKVRKSQAAHGLSVIEVELKDNAWQMVRPSRHAERFPMDLPFEVRGPAAGHAMMKTAADPAGTRVLGTLNNCAASKTPWGTYLSGEENFMGYFGGGDDIPAHHRRWGLRKDGFYQWEKFDARFDAKQNPNEPNRFGWVVEIDPYDPSATPVKRTALGRAAHEGAWVAVTKDGRAVVYSGEDARFEYIYKFVSRDKIQPGGAKANATLLDHGTLHVARFNADGTGQWLPLVHGSGPLTAGQRLRRSGRGADQGTPGQRRAGRDEDGPAGVARDRPADELGLLHADQQQQSRPAQLPRRRCRQPARQQRLRPDHPLAGRARLRCDAVQVESPGACRRPGQ